MLAMKLSIPSVDEIVKRSISAASRFPFALVCAVVATISALWFSEVEFEKTKEYYWLSDIIFVTILGISLFTGIQTLSESLRWQKSLNFFAKVIGLILLATYYFGPEGYITEGANETFYRYAVLFLISHLFVAFAPFLKSPNVNEFWGYNKTLFLNFLISALYSAVLFFGLSIALLSIDNLLGFDIKDVRYLQLWFILVGIFNTFFFLARVPKIGEFEPAVTEYPKALKVFVQYVLIPIVTIYILILYSYLIKIMVQWELPTGWVANLVLSFSIAGIFSLLLLHPIKDEAKNNWIRLYSKLYYIGLVPLVVLLFISIGTRISEYGVTINRFYVATLAVWLAGVVLYFILSKSKNIKVIPISMALIALGITFGPLSTFSVSERSQLGRITETLKKNNILDEEGTVIKTDSEIPFESRSEISSIVRYMIDNHDLNSLQPLFDDDLKSEIDAIENEDLEFRTKAEKIVLLMGMEYVNEWENVITDSLNQKRYYEFDAESKIAVDISSYDYSFNWLRFFTGTPEVTITSGEQELKLSPNFDEFTFVIKNKEDQELITIYLKEKIEYLQRNYPSGSFDSRVPVEVMIASAENEDLSIMMVIHTVGSNSGDDASLSNIQFTLYLTFK
ncbi:MAG: hypothetical protein CL671_12960 [Balneola sp.]|jgi:hypothetical protein|nr:hypothetical protein [Balneola sp.]MAO76330.1 hypothetical protein [Balneola sp.]MBF65521.1 hypothetical protein [Balneola sp.]|tara:strand:+ start:2243 stop:4105 length:1863 start_codon:yes stop_codon:yes gene_type:complete